jgi:hypothetical protein
MRPVVVVVVVVGITLLLLVSVAARTTDNRISAVAKQSRKLIATELIF